jgi:hypothetical protein
MGRILVDHEECAAPGVSGDLLPDNAERYVTPVFTLPASA